MGSAGGASATKMKAMRAWCVKSTRQRHTRIHTANIAYNLVQQPCTARRPSPIRESESHHDPDTSLRGMDALVLYHLFHCRNVPIPSLAAFRRLFLFLLPPLVLGGRQ